MKILIVDDSQTFSARIGQVLKEAGFDVIVRYSGSEGLQAAAENDSIGLIISDYNMPGMDGLQMIEAIRKLPAHDKTKVFMLTAETSLELKRMAKTLHVIAWIKKPIDESVLVSAVHNVLKNPA